MTSQTIRDTRWLRASGWGGMAALIISCMSQVAGAAELQVQPATVQIGDAFSQVQVIVSLDG